MVAGVQVKFGLVSDQVTPALKKQNAEFEKINKSIDRTKAKYTQAEKAAIRALRSTRTDTEKLAQVQSGLNRLVKRGILDRKQANQVASRFSARLREQSGLANRLRGQLAGVASSYISIGATIAGTIQLLRTQIELEKSRANLIRTAAESERTFSILNRAGDPDQEIRKVGLLGAVLGFGKSDAERAKLFNVAQGLQAGLGEGERQDREALETVLLARKAGVALDTANELVAQGISQTPEDPKQLLRLIFAAGELSQRDPTTIGGAAAVLNLFDDKVFGAAVATSIGNVRAADIKTFTQAAGLLFDEKLNLKKLGVTEKTPASEVLRARRDAVDPDQTKPELVAQLKDLGVNNVRALQAAIQLISTIDEIENRFIPEIRKTAVPGVFERAIALDEEQSKRFRALNAADREEALLFNQRVAGPKALGRQVADIQNRRFARALEDSPLEAFTTTDGGQLNFVGTAAKQLFEIPGDQNPIARALGDSFERLNISNEEIADEARRARQFRENFNITAPGLQTTIDPEAN